MKRKSGDRSLLKSSEGKTMFRSYAPMPFRWTASLVLRLHRHLRSLHRVCNSRYSVRSVGRGDRQTPKLSCLKTAFRLQTATTDGEGQLPYCCETPLRAHGCGCQPRIQHARESARYHQQGRELTVRYCPSDRNSFRTDYGDVDGFSHAPSAVGRVRNRVESIRLPGHARHSGGTAAMSPDCRLRRRGRREEPTAVIIRGGGSDANKVLIDEFR